MHIMHTRVNHLKNPYIDSPAQLSWVAESGASGCRQSAYHISVAREDGTAEWTSGWVESEQSLGVALPISREPLTRYQYTLRLRDAQGNQIPAHQDWFCTAKCDTPFAGQWITAAFCQNRDQAKGSLMLRRSFTLAASAARALLVICGLGYFDASINGVVVSDEFFGTPLSAYDQRVYYRVFDVTTLMHDGANVLGVVLGNGLYNSVPQDAWNTHTAVWRDVPKLLCELHIWQADGNHIVIASDSEWRSAPGPAVMNALRHGERFDARLLQDGWDTPAFDATTWQGVRHCRAPGGLLRVMEMEPIQVYRRLHHVTKKQVKDGWLFDLGIAQAGVANIRFHGKAGDAIAVRYSDLRHADGSLDQSSLSMFVKDEPFQTDVYIKRVDTPETWHPRFAYHGFTFLQISGTDWEPSTDDIEVWSLCNAFSQRGYFHCADPWLNRIQQAVIQTSRSMCFGTMASDSTREKLSWTGDTALSCEQMLINFTAESLFLKWMADLRDAQRPSGLLPCIIPTTGWGFTFANGPDWSHAVYEVPLQLYRHCGSVDAIADNYDTLCRHIQFLQTMAVEHIVAFGLGDWCAPFHGPAVTKNMSSFKCPVALSDTAFYYAAVSTAAMFAQVLDKPADADRYATLANAIRNAFRSRFYDPAAGAVTGDCQSATAIMIAFGLADDDEIDALVQRLVQQIAENDWKLDFGVLGMKAVLKSLGDHGYTQLALDMLTRAEEPSMGYWLRQGASTLWECWNGGGSHNHHMFSAVSAFFYQYVAGIRPLQPGYREIAFIPMLNGRLQYARASIESVRGTVACAWYKHDSGFWMQLRVPVSCRGVLHLPLEWDGIDTQQLLKVSSEGTSVNAEIDVTRSAKELQVAVPSGTWHVQVQKEKYP